MKKKLCSILLLLLWLFPSHVIYAKNINIFDTVYLDEYVPFVDSSWLNRLINEIGKSFNIEISEEQIFTYKYGQDIKITTNELNNEEQSFYIFSDFSEKHQEAKIEIVTHTSMDDLETALEYTTKLAQILDNSLSEEEVKEGFNNTLKDEKGGRINFGKVEFYNNRSNVNASLTIRRLINKSSEEGKFINLMTQEIEENQGKVLYPKEFETKFDVFKDEYMPALTFNPDDYNVVDYQEVLRDRTGKKGAKLTFYGTVLQYQEEGNMGIARVYTKGDYNNVYLLIFNSLPNQRLLEDDLLDIYGISDGLFTYESVGAGSITIPKVIVNHWEFTQ